MLRRLNVYFKEMYPIVPRLLLGFLLFFEMYFLVILTNSTGQPEIKIGYQEIIGGFTIFSFLLTLRIVDDFKDYETDLKLFPERPLPSGRVKKSDLGIFLTIIVIIVSALNLIFMNNQLFFIILFLYGLFMSFWFFNKYKIQNSLPLALITHNPVQIVLNIYSISFACKKYGIPILTLNNAIIALTLYFPGLIWEISRKVRAPKDETEYVTYSKLFGYKKVVHFIMAVMFVDVFTTSFLLYQLYSWSVITVLILYLWLIKSCLDFIKNPEKFRLVDKFEVYEYVAEISVVLFIGAKLIL